MKKEQKDKILEKAGLSKDKRYSDKQLDMLDKFLNKKKVK